MEKKKKALLGYVICESTNSVCVCVWMASVWAGWACFPYPSFIGNVPLPSVESCVVRCGATVDSERCVAALGSSVGEQHPWRPVRLQPIPFIIIILLLLSLLLILRFPPFFLPSPFYLFLCCPPHTPFILCVCVCACMCVFFLKHSLSSIQQTNVQNRRTTHTRNKVDDCAQPQTLHSLGHTKEDSTETTGKSFWFWSLLLSYFCPGPRSC